MSGGDGGARLVARFSLSALPTSTPHARRFSIVRSLKQCAKRASAVGADVGAPIPGRDLMKRNGRARTWSCEERRRMDEPTAAASSGAAAASIHEAAAASSIPADDASGGMNLSAVVAVVVLVAALIIPIFFLLRTQGAEDKKKVRVPTLMCIYT